MGDIMENKRDKFKRVAEKRVINALKSISLIGNLSNRRMYEYSPEDVTKIFKALKKEIKIAEESFEKATKTKKTFKL